LTPGIIIGQTTGLLGRVGVGRPKEKVMAKKEKKIGQGWGMAKGQEKAKKERVMGKTFKGKVERKEMGKEREREERRGKSPPVAWRMLSAG
jgi:hypothetical protein